MIQVIGSKRIIIIFVLIIISATLGSFVYLYLIPENTKSEREFRILRSQVSSVRRDLDRMQVEFEQLERQQDEFNLLKADGFFSNQVRSDAKELFSIIQEESNVISAVVSIKSGVILEYEEAKKANHSVLMSPIEVNIKAFDDASIYKYMEIASNKFPGHLSFDSVIIERLRDVSAPVLRAIASGANPELINARIKMSWHTMIPESQVILDDKF